jgi:hypothetical protein
VLKKMEKKTKEIRKMPRLSWGRKVRKLWGRGLAVGVAQQHRSQLVSRRGHHREDHQTSHFGAASISPLHTLTVSLPSKRL